MSAIRMMPATLALIALAGCQEPAPPEQVVRDGEPPVWDGALSTTVTPGVEGMVFVPGATFRMGTFESEIEEIRRATGLRSAEPLRAEVSAHYVEVSDFFMDALDVTNHDYAEFVAAEPAWAKDALNDSQHNGRYLEHWTADGPPEDLLDHPVTFITFHSAVSYCAWQGKRLPTEAEYEWAAQDGTTHSEYPWGDDPPSDDRVSWGGNGIDTTVPVGSYPPNPRGLYDMAGNVWRFTSDAWFGPYYPRHPNAHREAQRPDIRRVVRGGSWGANAANLRVRYRDSHRPYDAREMVGFRCALSVYQQAPRTE